MKSAQEKTFIYLQEKGIIKFKGSYSAWQNKEKVEEPKQELHLEDSAESYFKDWKSRLSKKEREQFEGAFGK